MAFQSTKTYGHNLGLSCAFRQWRATSHCSKIHGYALEFAFVFEADELDANGWVVDFGSLKPIKLMLEKNFDHTIAAAADDPNLSVLLALAEFNLADVKVFGAGVGCERFAEFAFIKASNILADIQPNARVVSCECREHGANSAIYLGDKR